MKVSHQVDSRVLGPNERTKELRQEERKDGPGFQTKRIIENPPKLIRPKQTMR
jgi:hypothetical protein